MRVEIKIKEKAGAFGENKDIAREIRLSEILPAIERGDEVSLDFKGMTGVTQSFIHALIAEPLMRFRDLAFKNLYYLDANDDISEIISIVYRYIQESFEDMER